MSYSQAEHVELTNLMQSEKKQISEYYTQHDIF